MILKAKSSGMPSYWQMYWVSVLSKKPVKPVKPVKKTGPKGTKRKPAKKDVAKTSIKLKYAKRSKAKENSKNETNREAKKHSFTSRFFAWVFKSSAFRLVAKILVVLALIPLVLTVLYKIEYVRPMSTLMLGRYLTFQEVKRDWVEIDDISPVLINSVIMSEDGKFCSHNGVDWQALNTVIDDALEGEKTRGASTLTMQIAKNLFLWNSRSYIRKGLEVPLALYTDLVLSKRRQMEIYLNIAEWDEGVFGIEAASKRYFKKSSKQLSSTQASLLTVTLPNPKGRNAARPTKSMRRVARVVAKRAKKSGFYVACTK